jgi:short-subunit dehydrogenase
MRVRTDEALAIIGTVEELAQSNRTISLVDEIFEINFFANVNIIKAILPVMRTRKNGHIIVITGISKFECRLRWMVC